MKSATWIVCGLLCSQPSGDIVTFSDGSQVSGKITAAHVTIETAYGKLKIPTAEITSVTFARRASEESEKKIRALIRGLSSDRHGERERASRELEQAGPIAMSPLGRLFNEKDALQGAANDAETCRRAEAIYNRLKVQWGEQHEGLEDRIDAANMGVSGKIVEDAFEFETWSLGKLTVSREKLWTISRRIEASLRIEADDKWHDTGIRVRIGQRLIIEASGVVDLWPNGPGQYMTGAKGYTSNGRLSAYPAGALMARVGGAPAYMVGERCDWTPSVAGGKLELCIIESPWANRSTGGYTVTIRSK